MSSSNSFSNESDNSNSLEDYEDIDQETISVSDSINLDLQEESIQNQINNIEFGKILKANEAMKKNKIKEKYNSKIANKSKQYLINKFNEKNKSLLNKTIPKESSALLKPSKLIQFKKKQNTLNTERFGYDPRFENNQNNNKNKFSILNDKRYLFLNDKSEDYLSKIEDISKNIKLDEEEKKLIRSQRENVKNYLSNVKHANIINSVNKNIKNIEKNNYKSKESSIKLKSKDKKDLFKSMIKNEKNQLKFKKK